MDPLVDPGPELTAEQRARAIRQLALPGFDELAQRRLANARVLVVGAGGLGSASIPYLAGCGIGTIGIVDDDVVELTNLHRQVAHGTADIGRPKVDSLADTVRALDPGIRVIPHPDRLTSENALDVVRGYDLVIDGSDNFPTRYLVNDAAQLAGIPLVWGAILRTHGQVSVAWHEHGPGYRDVFPAPPGPDDALSCEVGGVLPGLCGTVGSLLATEALKVITGVGDPLVGRVLIYDAMRVSFREIEVQRNPDAGPVTELIDYELFCAGPSATTAGTHETTDNGQGSTTDTPMRITPDDLASRLQLDEPLRLIDVRSADEFYARRITGTTLVPLDDLQAGQNLESGSPIVVICERGPRAVHAATLLGAQDHDVVVLDGGTREFARAYPRLVETGAPA